MVRFDDMLKVLNDYDLIHIMYKQLIKLEKENKKHSKEYKHIWELIDDYKRDATSLLLKYPVDDKYMIDFLNNILEIGKLKPVDHDDFVNYRKDSKYMRLCRSLLLLKLEHHLRDEDDFHINTKMVIDDQEMDEEEGFEYLSQYLSPEALENARNSMQLSDEEKALIKTNLDLNDNYLKTVYDLEAHIFMAYLEEAIEKNKDNQAVRDALIEAKYAIIYNIKSLEDTYSQGYKPEEIIPSFYGSLIDIFSVDSLYFTDFAEYEESKVTTGLEGLMERNKEKYEDMDDFIVDILRHISIRTFLTCIPSDSVRDESSQELQAASELAKSPIDKKLLEKSKKVNKKFVFNQ